MSKFAIIKQLALYCIIMVLFPYCASVGNMKGGPDDNLISDNYWVKPDILQLVVRAKSDDDNEPYTMQNDKVCQKAKDNIKAYLLSFYPKAESVSYKITIIRTIFLEPGECGLIIHVSGSDLKRKIQ